MEVEEEVVVEEDGEVEDGTKVDMEIMEDMVDMEGREDGTSFNFDSSHLRCLFYIKQSSSFNFLECYCLWHQFLVLIF